MKLDGKRVLVTGGSSGIGLAIAKALLAKGAKVAISGRRPALVSSALTELRGSRGEAVGVVADVGTAEGRTETLRHALDALGGLDILVNNAGGVRAGRLEVTTEAEIEAMLNVDLLAPILLTRAALPSLRTSGDAMVVNVTSGIALMGAPFYATYAAAKAGLARFGERLIASSSQDTPVTRPVRHLGHAIDDAQWLRQDRRRPVDILQPMAGRRGSEQMRADFREDV